MYEGLRVQLATDAQGRRWLTDGFVCLNVTDSAATLKHCDDGCCDHLGFLPDGVYKLTAARGLVARDGEVLAFDPDAYLARVEASAVWRLALPTEWSVAEHPGKAMLWRADGRPCLMGEPTWTSFRSRFDSPRIEYDTSGSQNVFRVSVGDVVAYVAGIRIPDGQEGQAHAVVDVEALIEQWEAA
jgi:hypothetical protein